MLVSTRYKALSVVSGPQARRGFEGVYLAGGRPTTTWAGGGERWRRRGIGMIGVELHLPNNKVQG